MQHGSLKQLFIYPVKSLAGIALSSSRLTLRGLEYDRRWMIVDAKGRFITQRLYPQLALISTRIDSGQVILSAVDLHELSLPLVLEEGESCQVQVWRDQVTALIAGKQANDWISHYLGVDCRFVYMPDSTQRQVNQEFALSKTDRVSFADGFPFLIISQASLDDLNEHLLAKEEQPVPIQRFRPNLFIEAPEAFAEDHWQTIDINGNRFHNVKPCSRCIMTTVTNGKKGKEPLATLMQYRQQGQQAYFGQNAILDSECSHSMQLHVGDPIEVIQSTLHE